MTLQRLTNPVFLGGLAGLLLMLGSFGGGAIRYRGGVLDALGLSFFSFGHGQGISNAVLFLGQLLLIGSWVHLGRALIRREEGVEKRLMLVKRSVLAMVVPLLFAAPMMSRDVYSYLMQGAMLRDGFDPYTEGAAVNPGPMLLEVSHDWRNTTTPYGPLHLWIGDMITSMVGDNVTLGVVAYKILSVAGFAAIAWSISKIAAHFGADQALALWIGVANPVMIIHMIGGMHNESLMVGLVSGGLYFVLNKRYAVGVALIAVAVSLKATAAIALPFIVWIGMHHLAGHWAKRAGSERPSLKQQVSAFVAAGSLGVAITGVVVSVITWLSGASWGWISEISGNSKVINPLAFPSLVASVIAMVADVFVDDFNYNVVVNVVRSISMFLMLAGLVLCWWLFRQNERRAIAGTAAAYAVAFVFNSVTLPWYYASLISLLGTFKPPSWLIRFAAGASVFIALMFTGSGNHQLYNIGTVIVSALIAWLATVVIFDETSARSSVD
ncbi:Alpha-(1-_6)-mannopyranosyltransferase A [Corynebacterium deserti GIMN1.010]|uniref:Alpha-(1->6)-mannopyranosyltransferase A n=1 Tax=Corynebacterium deserti GIMN1.010 TaxID=931089 RepID=A0A0M5IUB4_9CORY|nr:alpha-(1->6)-mannopyranosyltransferase A [Corynebacterium deserti]ALC06356.1 Alpha-(1->6)-mannopyranosyltransferase A [Corynebacterium deserti GIMN1.010]